MLEIVIFVGFQAAGKTTFYEQRFASTHVLVSKDRLRNHRRPERRQQRLIAEALAAGRALVVDNTNPSVEERASIIEGARAFGARVVGFHFASALEDCIRRNDNRSLEKRVPEVGFRATAKRLVPPSRREGFDELWVVQTLPEFQFTVTPLPEFEDES